MSSKTSASVSLAALQGCILDLVERISTDPVSVVKDISISVYGSVSRMSVESSRMHQRRPGQCIRIVSASTSVLTVVTEHFDAALEGQMCEQLLITCKVSSLSSFASGWCLFLCVMTCSLASDVLSLFFWLRRSRALQTSEEMLCRCACVRACVRVCACLFLC